MKPTSSELPIIQMTYDLILWYIPILNRLPRDHKFMLGDRLITRLYGLLDELILARYAREKLARLEPLNGELDFANLMAAARQAQRGKRFRDNVLAFNFVLEDELLALRRELESKEYRPGPYKTFQIVEPKKRMISAAPYRDRVVHHALCNVIGPVFERTFIAGSYANRAGFGTHRALRCFTRFARSSRYVLQCDVQKYFPSIDHLILKQVLRRKIKCPDTLWLADTIIDASNPQEPVTNYFPGDGCSRLGGGGAGCRSGT